MSSTLLIFYRFLQRDFYTARNSLFGIAFNWAVLVPTMYVFITGYLQPRVFLGANHGQIDMVMFIGSILQSMQLLSYKASVPLLFDLLGERYIEYQATLLKPQLVIIERIFFSTIFTFIMLIGFYPMAKLLLGSTFNTTATSWPAVMLMLLVSSLAMSTYNVWICCTLHSAQSLRKLWVRCNVPLLLLGGFWVPWHLIMKSHPWLAYATLANPLIYISEGLRRAFLNTPDFFAVSTCVAMLLLLSVVFTLLALRSFKKRIDHI